MRRKPKRIMPGDDVVIIESWHSDVVPQMRGVVTQKIQDGYVVKIEACFSDATGKRSVESRSIFFSREQLERPDV